MVPVKVTIVSWNKNDPEGPSTFIAFGKMTEKGGVTYVRYEESKLTGMDKTTTTLKWSEQALTIIRHGRFEHRQHYERGRNTLFQYRTPYFSLPMCVFTRQLEMKRGEGRWDLTLEYDMEIDRQPNGSLRLSIVVKEEHKSGHQESTH